MRKEKKKIAEVKVIAEPVEAAEEAGLRYVSENQPGYTRKAKNDEFEYSIRMAKQSAMSNGFCGSSGWPFRRHGQTFGFPRQQTATSRRLGAMHESANSTFITSVGAKYAMKTNTNELFRLGKRCRKSADG